MAVLPEVILQRAIIQGLRQVREDPRILDAIFRNLHQDQLVEVKNYILNNTINFSINFPRQEVRLPSIVMVLKNESEAETFLGDVMGLGPDQDISYDTLSGHGASVSGSSGLPSKIAGPLEIASQASPSRVLFSADASDIVSDLLKDPVPSMKAYVVLGTGAGKVYDVIAISPIGLDIEGTFEPQLDNTSVIDLRVAFDPELADGEPSRVYGANSSNLLRKGVNYDTVYQVHVIAKQQEHVLYLYSVLKALFLMQRKYLEGQGIMALKISGSDFAPRTEFLPTEVFQRMMTLQFTYPFSFIEELETFEKFNVGLLAASCGGYTVGATITLDTTIDVEEE